MLVTQIKRKLEAALDQVIARNRVVFTLSDFILSF